MSVCYILNIPSHYNDECVDFLSVMRIKNETGVAIRIPADGENSNIIRIEGNPEGVQKAKQELQEMATRMVRTITCCNTP